MSQDEGGSAPVPSAVDVAPGEPDKPPSIADSAPTSLSEHSDDSPGDESDVDSELKQLKELNKQHTEIIALLRQRFDILVDISEKASALMKGTRKGWKSLYPTPRVDRDSAEGLLLKMIPCGMDFMGINVADFGSSGKDSGESSKRQKESLQERHIQVTEVLKNWVKALSGRVHARDINAFPEDLAWKPVILPHGRPIEDPSDCEWPDNWESPLNKRQSSLVWNLFAVVPPRDVFAAVGPQYGKKNAGFDVERILNFSTDIDTAPSTRETNITHPPIHGVICALRVELSRQLLSFQDLATFIPMSSYTSICDISDMRFFRDHFGPWRSHWGLISGSVYEPYPEQDEEPFSFGLSTFGYHMKSFKFAPEDTTENETEEDKGKTNESSNCRFPAWGIQIEREVLSVEDASGKRRFLLEHRYSTLISMTPHCRPIGNFRLLSVEDTVEHTHYRPDNPIWQSKWKETGIHPAGLLTGIAVFQTRMYWVTDLWAMNWKATLDQLSASFSVKPKSIENEEELKDLMYDPSSKRTRTYFKVLQILRIFSDMIETADVELDSFSDACSTESYHNTRQDRFPAEELVIQHNWAVVKAFRKEKTKKLLVQISSMNKEIESLRAGLFNAQSVKEAQKSRELNKIMMVFTIVTILFLPPTFVATFFGVDIFHSASDVETRKIFWTVFSIVTVTTFALSLGAILGLLTSAGKTLLGLISKPIGSTNNLPAEQEDPERTQSTWRRLSSFLRRDRTDAPTSDQDSTLSA